MTLQSGTYGKKALREIPKPKHMKKKGKGKSGSKASLLTPSQSQPFVYPPPQQTSSPTGTLQQPGRKAPLLPYESAVPRGQPYPAQPGLYPVSQGPPQYQQYPMQDMPRQPGQGYVIDGAPTEESEL